MPRTLNDEQVRILDEISDRHSKLVVARKTVEAEVRQAVRARLADLQQAEDIAILRAVNAGVGVSTIGRAFGTSDWRTAKARVDDVISNSDSLGVSLGGTNQDSKTGDGYVFDAGTGILEINMAKFTANKLPGLRHGGTLWYAEAREGKSWEPVAEATGEIVSFWREPESDVIALYVSLAGEQEHGRVGSYWAEVIPSHRSPSI